MASWLTQVFNFLAGGSYETSRTPIVAGSSGPLACDAYGRLIVAPSALGAPFQADGLSWDNRPVPAASRVVNDDGPGALFGAFASNEGSDLRWLMFFDAAAVPSNGASPMLPGIPLLPADGSTTVGTASLEFVRGRPYITGLVWAISSTPGALTIDSGATVAVVVEYV